MENEPFGTKRTGVYGPAPKSNKSLLILLALAAVAVLLYFGMGRKEVAQSGLNRNAPGSFGRRSVDDRTVRPNDAPRPNDPARDINAVPNDTIVPLPNDTQPVPPADDQPAPAPNQPSKF